MENKTKNFSLIKLFRSLHRDIGALLIGMTIVYTLSGIILIYRDKGFTASGIKVVKTLDANLKLHSVREKLNLWKLVIIRETDDEVIFKGGKYNRKTGKAEIMKIQYPFLIDKMNKFHMVHSRIMVHILGVIYAICLLFLALSSFFMYKTKSAVFRRYIFLTAIGCIIAAAAVLP